MTSEKSNVRCRDWEDCGGRASTTSRDVKGSTKTSSWKEKYSGEDRTGLGGRRSPQADSDHLLSLLLLLCCCRPAVLACLCLLLLPLLCALGQAPLMLRLCWLPLLSRCCPSPRSPARETSFGAGPVRDSSSPTCRFPLSSPLQPTPNRRTKGSGHPSPPGSCPPACGSCIGPAAK